MKRFAMILGLGASLAFGAQAADHDPLAGSPGDEATPEVAGMDRLLGYASIPADGTFIPCLPQVQVRLVSRADGKVHLIVSDIFTPTCQVPDEELQPRIYPVDSIYVDPKYVWKDFLAGEGGRSARFRVKRDGAELTEKDRAPRRITGSTLMPLESRTTSLVALETRCREGGQTLEETAFLVAPLNTWDPVVEQRYRDTPGDCRTVANFLTTAGLSDVQVRGYLSLIQGTTRVAAHRAEAETEVRTFKEQMQRLDAHMIDVERRLPNLRALRPETHEPFVAWSRNLVRKALASVYWEGLFEPEHLAGERWIALDDALKQVRRYFEHLADILRDIEKKPGVPRADVDALVRFIADERAFWQELKPERTMGRAWPRSLANLRAMVLQHLTDRPAPPAPHPPAE